MTKAQQKTPNPGMLLSTLTQTSNECGVGVTSSADEEALDRYHELGLVAPCDDAVAFSADKFA